MSEFARNMEARFGLPPVAQASACRRRAGDLPARNSVERTKMTSGARLDPRLARDIHARRGARWCKLPTPSSGPGMARVPTYKSERSPELSHPEPSTRGVAFGTCRLAEPAYPAQWPDNLQHLEVSLHPWVREGASWADRGVATLQLLLPSIPGAATLCRCARSVAGRLPECATTLLRTAAGGKTGSRRSHNRFRPPPDRQRFWNLALQRSIGRDYGRARSAGTDVDVDSMFGAILRPERSPLDVAALKIVRTNQLRRNEFPQLHHRGRPHTATSSPPTVPETVFHVRQRSVRKRNYE